MTRRGLLAVGILSWLTGCDGDLPPEDPVRLPLGMAEGATDPLRWAVAQVQAQLHDRPQDLLGRPELGARAMLLVEYLSTAFMAGNVADAWQLTRLWRGARGALRGNLGLRTDVPPVVMAAALEATAAALARNDQAAARAALAPVADGDPLARLDRPPVLNTLRRALRETQDALRQR